MKRLFKHLFGTKTSTKNHKAPDRRVRLGVEDLEERLLLACDISLDQGVLHIQGGEFKDYIVAERQDDGQILAQAWCSSDINNGYESYSYIDLPAEAIDKIVFDGFHGDDEIYNWTGIADEIYQTPDEPTPPPADPAPMDPAPIDPAPADPLPIDPAPMDPAPAEPAPADPGPAANLNDAVLAYAVNAMGSQVGNGECWTLVDEALRAAGADTSGNNNYVFGRPVGVNDVLPGDVLQFEGVTFFHQDENGWYSQNFAHHTAIVSSVDGNQITLLNQNVNGDRTVQYTTINLSDWQGGDISAYRPQAA